MSEGRRLRPEVGATISQWAYISESALTEANGITTSITYQYAAFSNANLLFNHTLEHPIWPNGNFLQSLDCVYRQAFRDALITSYDIKRRK